MKIKKEPTTINEVIEMYKVEERYATYMMREGRYDDMAEYRRFCRKAIKVIKKYFQKAH
jgi:hypothetical protein